MIHSAPVSRDFMRILIERIDRMEYGPSIRGGLTPDEQRARNKALISILYLSARRISEIVGREYKGDIHRGVLTRDFSKSTMEGRDVLIVRCRILKKWNRKTDEPRLVEADIIIPMAEQPFVQHVLAWLQHQRKAGVEKYMPMCRQRAYQILQQVDPRIVGPHWFRHQRLSHLAEHLSPYELNERIGFWQSIDPAVSYVHGRVSAYLDACDRVRGAP
jgi:integrase